MSSNLSELFSQLKHQADLLTFTLCVRQVRALVCICRPLCPYHPDNRFLPFRFVPAGGEVVFLERQEGESVLLPCALGRRDLSPFGASLKRTWLQPGQVLFKHTESEFTTASDSDKRRTSVSGDPSTHQLNVSISGLRVGDTDRYSCEFLVEKVDSSDLHLPGTTDFFLLVTGGEFSFLTSGVLPETASKWKKF